MYHNLIITTTEGETNLYKTTTTGYLENNYLSYHTDSDTIKINLHTFKFTKENIETILKITQDKCSLTLKELNQTLDIPLEFINFEFVDNKYITISYKLISMDLPLKINIEIGSVNNEI